LTLSSSPSGLDEGLTLNKSHRFIFIVARQTNASLTAELEQLRPVKEQLDSLWIVLAVVFTLGVLF